MTKADQYSDRINKLERQVHSLMEVVETLTKQHPHIRHAQNSTLTNTGSDLKFTKEKAALTDF